MHPLKHGLIIGGYAAPSQDAPVYSGGGGGQEALGGYQADAGAAGSFIIYSTVVIVSKYN